MVFIKYGTSALIKHFAFFLLPNSGQIYERFVFPAVGTSQNSCSQIYSGTRAESEVEAVHIRQFMTSHMGEWEVYLTLHSYSQLWMAPWGYTFDPPQDYLELVSQQHIELAKIDYLNTEFVSQLPITNYNILFTL